MRNVGDKLPALAVAVGQPIPLRGDFARQLDKGIAQDRHFILAGRLKRLGRQLLNRADAVLLQPGHVQRELFNRARHPVPEQQPRQQTKQRHQQHRPQRRTPERFVPGHIRQRVGLLPLQNNVQIPLQLTVLPQRGGAEDFLIMASGIVAKHRHHRPAEEILYRRKVNFLPLNVPRRGGIGQDIAIWRDNIQLDARIKGHQPVEQRF